MDARCNAPFLKALVPQKRSLTLGAHGQSKDPTSHVGPRENGVVEDVFQVLLVHCPAP